MKIKTSIHKIIYKHFSFLDKACDQALNDLVIASIQFLLKEYNQTEFRNNISLLIDKYHLSINSINDFKTDLRFNGYLLYNLKTYLFYCIKNNLNAKQSKILMREFDIKFCDFTILRIWKKSGLTLDKVSKYKALHINNLRKNLTESLLSCESYTRSFVYKKLRFIAMSGSIEIEDLTYELLGKAYDALLAQYPIVESKLHFTNICKRAIHNYGINMIHFYTSKSRAHLTNIGTNGKNEFVSTTIGLTAFTQSFENRRDLEEYGIKQNCQIYSEESYMDEEEQIVSEETVRSIMDSCSGKKKKFLTLLSGTYDVKFSKYLGESNDELYDNSDLDSYKDLVCDYLNISGYQANVFLNQLRQSLGD